jgi:hypothetical protein
VPHWYRCKLETCPGVAAPAQWASTTPPGPRLPDVSKASSRAEPVPLPYAPLRPLPHGPGGTHGPRASDRRQGPYGRQTPRASRTTRRGPDGRNPRSPAPGSPFPPAPPPPEWLRAWGDRPEVLGKHQLAALTSPPPIIPFTPHGTPSSPRFRGPRSALVDVTRLDSLPALARAIRGAIRFFSPVSRLTARLNGVVFPQCR